jgi:hypothetical protein
MTLRPRRERPWWRSRRLVALIVAVDLLGVAALAYALTRPTSPSRTPTVTQAEVTAETLAAMHRQQHAEQQALKRAEAKRRAGQRHKRQLPAASAGTPRSGNPTDASVSTSAARASFDRLAASQPGQVGVAVTPLGSLQVATFGPLQVGHGWSTMKVPVLTTLLRQLEHSGGSLDPAGRDDATRALHASDNAAAEALFSRLEASDGGLNGASTAVQDTLRAAGDSSTTVNTAPNSGGFTTWGQTEWPASAAVTFYRALAAGCLLSGPDTGYVLGLMQGVESDQRWGAGSAGYDPNAALGFKGGWGPEDGGGYLVRQSAIVTARNGTGWVLTYLAKPSDGSFGTGTQMLTALAAWAAKTYAPDAAPPSGGGC